jgi:flavin-dependent thymidylate synthase
MYTAPGAVNPGDVHPAVTLVSMTANPLRVIAAASELYAGRVVRDPGDVDKELALRSLAEMTKTAIQAPLEFVDLHFLFEDVTRAFTHQLVRQRTAVYVQESLRFSVKGNAGFEVAMPASISNLPEDDPKRVVWQTAVYQAAGAYLGLVNSGIPAEDARSLLPTNITTKVHYKTSLRNLVEHSGMRLCSQAQHEWKAVWSGMVRAIMSYGPAEERWQQREIAKLFKPICYRTGKCEFMSATDRHCAIRDRVEMHHRRGESSEFWTDINQYEPLKEGAARLAPDMA